MPFWRRPSSNVLLLLLLYCSMYCDKATRTNCYRLRLCQCVSLFSICTSSSVLLPSHAAYNILIDSLQRCHGQSNSNSLAETNEKHRSNSACILLRRCISIWTRSGPNCTKGISKKRRTRNQKINCGYNAEPNVSVLVVLQILLQISTVVAIVALCPSHIFKMEGTDGTNK